MKITFELDEDTGWEIEADNFFQLIWGLTEVFDEADFLEKGDRIDVVSEDQRYILDKAGI